MMFILVFAGMMVFPGETDQRSVSYQKVKQFMDNYYAAYNQSAQDASSIDLMDAYWAPEFLSTQYIPVPQYPVMDCATWKAFMVYVHLNVKETLTVDELSIDTKALTVVSRLSIKFNYRSDGSLALKVDAIAFYNLKVDKKCKLKQTALKLYFADPISVMILSGPPPGM
jgi:hypothetical protein